MRTQGPIQEKLRSRLDKPSHGAGYGHRNLESPMGVFAGLPEPSFSLTGEEILSAIPAFPQKPVPVILPDWVEQLIAKTMTSFQPLVPTVQPIEETASTQTEPIQSAPTPIEATPLVEESAPVGYEFKPFSFSAPKKPVIETFEPPAVALEPSVMSPMVTKSGDLSYDKPNCSVELDLDDGGPMVDLSGYQDLTRPPVTGGDASPLATASISETFTAPVETPIMTTPASMFKTATHPEMMESEYKVEYSGNVKTLVQLVGDLPDGVTKQTGAQIIRLTMEAMGISMENVLSEAQTAQSELLDAARSNIKKIEEYKTIIRKLETESRFHQGKANELSEIIDLFILSNTLPNNPMDAGNGG